MEYDNSMHAHIGYYEAGYDIEAVAYKRKNEDVWDVFFPFMWYGLSTEPWQESKYMDGGLYIFSIFAHDFSWKEGSEKFEEWLLAYEILEKIPKK